MTMKKGFFILIMLLTGLFVYRSFANSNYFDIAEQRIKKYNPKRKDIVIIVDYRKNILTKRLFVLDMKEKKILISTTVSHAWNSGVMYPNEYSNIHGSNMTSSGNYITRGTRYGYFGYSMIIDGLDNGINNNARSRAVIFHSDRKMKTKWSNGCFATPEETNIKIINLTKNGVLVCVIE
jgi:hypothetical protein